MSRFVARRLVAAAVLSASALTPVAVGAATTSADAVSAKMCRFDHMYVKSTKKGSSVWIPTSNHFSSPSNKSGWQQGGQQGYSESDGAQTAKTKGSSDTAEVGGGINYGIGSVSTKYSHQWNRSTTTGNSVTKTWQQSVTLPNKVSRMRIYQAGYHFKVTYVIVNDGGPRCPNRDYTTWAVLPTKAKVTAMLVELYKNRGKLRPRG
jgi:hypothetical protein